MKKTIIDIRKAGSLLAVEITPDKGVSRAEKSNCIEGALSGAEKVTPCCEKAESRLSASSFTEVARELSIASGNGSSNPSSHDSAREINSGMLLKVSVSLDTKPLSSVKTVVPARATRPMKNIAMNSIAINETKPFLSGVRLVTADTGLCKSIAMKKAKMKGDTVQKA